MGNIGSEVERAFNAKRKGDKAREEAAMIRALDLFDATAEAWTGKKSLRLKEILRARENFLEILLNNFSEEEANGLEQYFMNFALAERRMHYRKAEEKN
jgi:hypothetical protein